MVKKTNAKKREEMRTLLAQFPILAIDPHPNQTGVLLSHEIEFFSKNHNLIKDFDPSHLKPAGYELTVGDEWYLGGKYYHFQDDDPNANKIEIQPFEVAVIKTAEIIVLPRFLIARWNLRVRYAYEGLLWLGGPQVDPGFKGHLFCPIYNLSDRPVTIQVGDEIALIDFVKTTNFNNATCVRYPDPPSRLIIEDYNIEHLRSALFTKAGLKIEEFGNTLRTVENRFLTFTTITFAILAVIISVIVGMFRITEFRELIDNPIYWVSAFTLFASFSVLLAIFRYLGTRYIDTSTPWLRGLVIAFGLAAIITVATVIWMPKTEFAIFQETIEKKTDFLDDNTITNIKKLDTELKKIDDLQQSLDVLRDEVKNLNSRSQSDAEAKE